MTTRKAQREASRGRDESLGMLVSCISAAAMLAFISPQLLLGTLGYVLGSGAILAIILAVVCHLRQGGSMAGAFVLVLLAGSLTTGTMFGIWWYFVVYLPAQPNLLNVGALGTSINSQPTAAAHTDSAQSSTSPIVTTAASAQSVPSAAAQVCGTAAVREVQALALRAAPARKSPQLATVAQGTHVGLICAPLVRADDLDWYKVKYGAIEGWMSARYLDIQQP